MSFKNSTFERLRYMLVNKHHQPLVRVRPSSRNQNYTSIWTAKSQRDGEISQTRCDRQQAEHHVRFRHVQCFTPETGVARCASIRICEKLHIIITSSLVDFAVRFDRGAVVFSRATETSVIYCTSRTNSRATEQAV